MILECLAKSVKTNRQPADIFRALFVNSGYSYWLDSSRLDTGDLRFSFMGDESGPHGHIVNYRVAKSITVSYLREKR
jgi:para-aminobenzoate synthetase